MNNTIRCGKFGNILYEERDKNNSNKIRLFSKNPNQIKTRKYTPISTNGQFVKYEGKVVDIGSFVKLFNTITNPIVLTHREYEILVEIEYSLFNKMHIFELQFPIFSDVKYISNINKSYGFLSDKLKMMSKIEIQGISLTRSFSIKDKYHIEKKLKFKNSLDSFFYFAFTYGYQEVFKLKEEREDRVVVAFDFNSMYASCMDGEFIEPKSIQYKSLLGEKIEYERLPTGLYRVIFKIPKDGFFKSFHPFKYTVMGKRYNFELNSDDMLEVLIFKEELDYYKSFFHDYELIEVFFSSKTIKHPLFKKGVKTYRERLEFKKDGNKVYEKMCKLKLAMMHSATNPIKKMKNKFHSSEELINFVIKHYGFYFDCEMKSLDRLQQIESTPKFSLTNGEKNDTWVLISPDIQSNESIYSISAKVVSIAKLKMIKVIEKFLKHKSVEICYSNTDSIHISILKDELDLFLKSHVDLISDDMGGLKIQSVSTKGYWFDVGRYWLVDNNRVVQYKNIFFNNKNSNKKFDKYRKVTLVTLGNFFDFTTVKYKHINNAFSYSKKVSDDNSMFERFHFKEISDFKAVHKSYCKELLHSKKIKSDLFNKLTNKYES